jgi:peptidoglycan-associated lipoprotein
MKLPRTLVVVSLALLIGGCPKRIPELELKEAEEAVAGLKDTEPCAPETTRAARDKLENARALLKEGRNEEARTELLAAKKLAEKARAECDEKKKNPPPPPPPEQKPAEPAARSEAVPGPERLQTVYFGFNDASLTEEAKEMLSRNAEYLRQRPGLRVQIEGHCDERGSTEYNLALGERRAYTVKTFLIKLGVEAQRLEIISYGEENPADPRHNEIAWARNRRAEFRELK